MNVKRVVAEGFIIVMLFSLWINLVFILVYIDSSWVDVFGWLAIPVGAFASVISVRIAKWVTS